MMAALVVWAVLVLTALAICSDSKRRDQAHARAIHPSNYVEVTDAAVVPLICPICLTPFATGYLSESGGTVGGWIELATHDCRAVKA